MLMEPIAGCSAADTIDVRKLDAASRGSVDLYSESVEQRPDGVAE